jgi:nucleoid-associated protein YgaU
MAIGSSLAAGLQRAILTGPGKPVAMMLNPTTLKITLSSTWHAPRNRSGGAAQPAVAKTGKAASTVPAGYGPQQYTGGQPAKLSMTVWFDQSFEPDGDITDEVNQLQYWTYPTEKVSSGVQNPPLVTFTWGSLTFDGNISQLTITYKLFGTNGKPVRAQADITLSENPSDTHGTNPTSGGISGRRVHVVSAGDSLHSVAYTEYGNAGLWRVLAEANGIDDPLRVVPGTTLLIPPPPAAGASL